MNNSKQLFLFKVFDSKEEAFKSISPMKSKQVRVNKTYVCISRIGDELFALKDECPHYGASLSAGYVNSFQEVICPWHSYRFKLKTGEEMTGHDCWARPYEIIEKEDGIYVGFKQKY